MSKSYNDYFAVADENGVDDDVLYYLKVENNKIIGATFSMDRHVEPVEINTLLNEVIGEDFRDFVIEKILQHEYEADWRVYNDIDAFDGYRTEEIRNAEDLGLSVPDYQKKVASILETKERKSTLGKADIINRISQIKKNVSSK